MVVTHLRVKIWLLIILDLKYGCYSFKVYNMVVTHLRVKIRLLLI
jgi:hypothetical protein